MDTKDETQCRQISWVQFSILGIEEYLKRLKEDFWSDGIHWKCSPTFLNKLSDGVIFLTLLIRLDQHSIASRLLSIYQKVFICLLKLLNLHQGIKAPKQCLCDYG